MPLYKKTRTCHKRWSKKLRLEKKLWRFQAPKPIKSVSLPLKERSINVLLAESQEMSLRLVGVVQGFVKRSRRQLAECILKPQISVVMLLSKACLQPTIRVPILPLHKITPPLSSYSR